MRAHQITSHTQARKHARAGDVHACDLAMCEAQSLSSVAAVCPVGGPSTQFSASAHGGLLSVPASEGSAADGRSRNFQLLLCNASHVRVCLFVPMRHHLPSPAGCRSTALLDEQIWLHAALRPLIECKSFVGISDSLAVACGDLMRLISILELSFFVAQRANTFCV